MTRVSGVEQIPTDTAANMLRAGVFERGYLTQ